MRKLTATVDKVGRNYVAVCVEVDAEYAAVGYREALEGLYDRLDEMLGTGGDLQLHSRAEGNC